MEESEKKNAGESLTQEAGGPSPEGVNEERAPEGPESVVEMIDAPIIELEGDFLERDPFSPAYVLVPAALVEPVWYMLRRLPERSVEGEVSRALEMLLIALDEQDFTMLGSAADQLVRSLTTLGRRRVLASVDVLRRLAQIESMLDQGDFSDAVLLELLGLHRKGEK